LSDGGLSKAGQDYRTKSRKSAYRVVILSGQGRGWQTGDRTFAVEKGGGVKIIDGYMMNKSLFFFSIFARSFIEIPTFSS
jgi:hypothetical protein